MVGYAQPAFGVVIEQVAQSLNIRTILSFPPKNVILTLHITMTLVILLSGFPLSRYLGRDWFTENNVQTWQLRKLIVPTKFLFLETRNIFFISTQIFA